MAVVRKQNVIVTSYDVIICCCGPQWKSFGRTSCPLSFVVIALIFSEFRGWCGIRPPPGPTRPVKARSE